MITRLPTLTRTPLPTLTPTALVTAAAVLPKSEPVTETPVAAPTLNEPPTSPAPPPTSAPLSEPATAPAPANPPEQAPAQPTAPTGELPPAAPTGELPPTPTPLPAPTETPTPLPPPTEAPPPRPAVETAGWAVDGVRVRADEFGEGLLLYGNLTNNTGVSQALILVTGNFYDDQGQLIANEENTIDYWPIDVVPPGGQAPFELIVDGVQAVANFSLNVEAEPSDHTPRQDFEFVDMNQWTEEGAYCLAGHLRNGGNALEEYLMIAAVLYDDQDNVVKFGDYYEPYPEEVSGSQPLAFELCVDSTGQGVARHELVAWGG